MDNPIDGTDGKLGRGFMSADKLEEIYIGDYDKPRPTFISANLDSSFRKELIKLLKEYATTQFGIFEAEDMRRDRKACVEAKQVAVTEYPSDGESMKTSKTDLEGLLSLLIKKGYFRLLAASI
jgi:hypothetical protein